MSELSGIRRTLGSQNAWITTLWVLMVCFSIGGALVLCEIAVRLRALEQAQIGTQEAVMKNVNARLEVALAKPELQAPANQVTQSATVTSTEENAGTASLPATSRSQSPSGALTRGSLSPDGSKFAGYEENKVGKKGVAVEIVTGPEAKKVKYIVIFNVFTESTAATKPEGATMSVRWKDASTIEYDVLTKKGNDWVKGTNTVKIFF